MSAERTVLSVENSLNWSWSFGLQELSRKMGFRFIRMQRIPGFRIADDLVNYFDVTLLQNLDTIKQVSRDLRHRVVSRIGGMFVNETNSPRRYDEELRSVAAVIATNQQLYEIGKRVNEHTYLIPNAVDLERFRPAPSRTPRRFTIGFAGNVWGHGAEYKGWRHYTRAMHDLFCEVDHLECLFQHSQIPHEDMAEEFYHRIDCLVLPSMGEGCSNVTMEALACGVPVLTTRVGYHGEALTDGENVLFIQRDEHDIVAKIRLLMRDEQLRQRLADAGRQFAERNHNITVVAQQYDQIFTAVIERSNAHG